MKYRKFCCLSSIKDINGFLLSTEKVLDLRNKICESVIYQDKLWKLLINIDKINDLAKNYQLLDFTLFS